MKYFLLVSFLLRAGLATVFLYAAVSAFLNPQSWVGYFPAFITTLFSPNALLIAFSVYEIVLALWLMSGIRPMYAAITAAATLVAIIIGNLTLMDIVFRDVAIFFAALALAALHWNERV